MRISKGLVRFIKPFLIILICISAGIFYNTFGIKDIAGAISDEDTNITDSQNPDIIIIDNDDYERDRKGPVRFEHKKHAYDYEVSCWECHHEYEDGENIWSPWGTTLACIDCHDPETKFDNILKLQTAYHNNCKTCHKEQAIFGDNPLDYRKCNKCHEKAQ